MTSRTVRYGFPCGLRRFLEEATGHLPRRIKQVAMALILATVTVPAICRGASAGSVAKVKATVASAAPAASLAAQAAVSPEESDELLLERLQALVINPEVLED